MTAGGLETISRKNLAADVDAIFDLARRHHVVEIVIGLPQTTDGSEAEHAMKIVAFGKKLAQASGLPVIYEEEGLSSVSSIRTLTVQSVKSGHSKDLDLVDRQAAAIILQKYLDEKKPPPTA